MFAHIFKGPSERPLHATTTVAIRSKPIAPVIGYIRRETLALEAEMSKSVQKYYVQTVYRFGGRDN